MDFVAHLCHGRLVAKSLEDLQGFKQPRLALGKVRTDESKVPEEAIAHSYVGAVTESQRAFECFEKKSLCTYIVFIFYLNPR